MCWTEPASFLCRCKIKPVQPVEPRSFPISAGSRFVAKLLCGRREKGRVRNLPPTVVPPVGAVGAALAGRVLGPYPRTSTRCVALPPPSDSYPINPRVRPLGWRFQHFQHLMGRSGVLKALCRDKTARRRWGGFLNPLNVANRKKAGGFYTEPRKANRMTAMGRWPKVRQSPPQAEAIIYI